MKQHSPERGSFFRKLAEHALVYSPSQFISALTSFAGLYIYTRLLTPQAYGKYSVALAVISLIGGVGGQWLQQSILRFFPESKKQSSVPFLMHKVSVVLGLECVIGVVLAIALYPFGVHYLGSDSLFILVVCVTAANTVFLTLIAFFQADLRPRAWTKYGVTHPLLQLGTSLLLVFLLGRRIEWLLAATLLTSVALTLVATIELGFVRGVRELGETRGIVPNPSIGTLLNYGFPVVGWSLTTMLLFSQGRILLNSLRGSGEVGIYASAHSLAVGSMGFFFGPLLLALTPLVMHVWNADHPLETQGLLSDVSKYFLVVALPITVFLTTFSKDLAAVFLGKSFQEGYTIVPLLGFGFLGWQVGLVGHTVLALTKRTHLMFCAVAICAAANLVLNIVLIPMQGYKGAAIADFLGGLLYPVLVYIFAMSQRCIAWKIPWKSWLKIALAALALQMIVLEIERTGVGSSFIIVRDVIAVVLGGLAYYASLRLLGEVKSLRHVARIAFMHFARDRRG